MRRLAPALLLLLASSASCALVLGYGDYTEQEPTSSTTGTGGAAPACPDGAAPSIEICGNDVDEDCDGVKCAHAAVWSHRYADLASPAHDRAIAAVAIVGSDIAVAGWYNGALDLGGGHALADAVPDQRELFAARLGTDGSTKSLAPDAPLPGEAAAVALNGAGTHLAATGFVETGAANGRDLYVHRSAPTKTWTKQLGSTGSDRGTALAFDAQNDVLVAGILAPGTGSLPCAAGDVGYAASAPRMLVVKLAAADGACLWGRTFAAPTISAQGIAVDASGQVIVAGVYSGALPGAAEPDAIGPSTFVLALDAKTGATAWTRAFPVTAPSSFATPTALAAGAGGRLYLSGSIRGTATFGAKPLSSTVPTEEDALVLALDGSPAGQGALVWAHRFGGASGFKRATAIGAVPGGDGDDVFVAGLAAGAMSVEPDGDEGALCPLGGVFLMKLGGERPVWGDCFGQGGVDGVDVVRMATSGQRVVLAGARTLPISFGGDTLPGTTFDAFAALFLSP